MYSFSDISLLLDHTRLYKALPPAAQGHLPLHPLPPELPYSNFELATFPRSGPLGGQHYLYYLFLHLEVAQRGWNLSGLSLSFCLLLVLGPDVLQGNWLNFLLSLRLPEDELVTTPDTFSLAPQEAVL